MYAIELPATAAFDYPTVALLSEYIVSTFDLLSVVESNRGASGRRNDLMVHSEGRNTGMHVVNADQLLLDISAVVENVLGQPVTHNQPLMEVIHLPNHVTGVHICSP